MPARSRSENPINRSRQGGFTYLPESAGSYEFIRGFHIMWKNFTINLVVMKNVHFIFRFSASIYATSCDARKDQNSFTVKSTSLVESILNSEDNPTFKGQK